MILSFLKWLSEETDAGEVSSAVNDDSYSMLGVKSRIVAIDKQNTGKKIKNPDKTFGRKLGAK